MNFFREYFQKSIQKLPDICTSKDLVEAGIYKSLQAIAYARKKHDCPKYIRISGRGIIYHKQAVIDFLDKKILEGETND